MAELLIDKEYYNLLDMKGFACMMKNPSYCYKFFWLEAIVKLISKNICEASYNEIIDQMIVNAWYPVLEYHIHLSGIYGDGIVNDSLENAVTKLSKSCGLTSVASEVEIKNQIVIYEKEIHSEKRILTQNVPVKALSGFANKGTETIDINNTSTGRMMAYYNRLNESSLKLPYTFGADIGLNRLIYFNSDWIQMIKDNTVNILGWIDHEKAKWLQANNPEVPGIVYKLEPADASGRKLEHVRKLWECIMDIRPIIDIFDDTTVKKDAYDVDHFIPRSFVMNDELWNLCPMDSSLNSAKNNRLPYWDPFFGKFADNQYILYELLNEYDHVNKLFKNCYKDNLHSIWANGELYRKGNTKPEFCKILEKNMQPLFDSAHRQGYEMWNRKKVG